MQGGAGSIPGWELRSLAPHRVAKKQTKTERPVSSNPANAQDSHARDSTSPGPLTDTLVNPGMDSGPVQRPHSAPLSSRDCSSPTRSTPATTLSPEGPWRKCRACSRCEGSWAHVGSAQQATTLHLPPSLPGELPSSRATSAFFLSPGSARPWKAFSTHPGDCLSADSVGPGDGRGQGLRLWPRAGLHPVYPTIPGPEGPEGTFPALKPAEGSGLAHATRHSPEL